MRARSWLSEAVVKTRVLVNGIRVLRSMIVEKNPPALSMPRSKGVTSMSNVLLSSGLSSVWAWTAAPMATTSSGWTLRLGSRPNSAEMASRTRGMRV